MKESKEYMMNRAKTFGEYIINETFELYKKEPKALIELMKNGIMGGAK